MDNNTTDKLLLPTNVKPLAYDIALTPDKDLSTFKGKVNILLNILESTNSIILHSKELDIKQVNLVINKKNIKAFDVQIDKENEKILIKFGDKLDIGEANLFIDYDGVINNQMTGFYRSSYHIDGHEKIIAVTQFEDTSARMAFPCFDEPNIKASFKINLTIPKHLDALSNMSIEKVALESSRGTKTVYFKESPIMSTYIVAFCIGEFEYIESVSKEGIPIRVYTTENKKALGHFALKVALDILSRCESYFDYRYMGSKLDLIAIPDFAAGAMENLGLVTFRENSILIDESNSSRLGKQNVALTVAHEIVHMWFGNLVTMNWWDELWLNESFATVVSYILIDELYPEWNVWNKFVVEEYSSALNDDALRSTHSIHMEIKSKHDIGQNFDSISYEKGASILRMLRGFIGDELFMKGLQLYISRHAYRNAKTEDLWVAFSEVSNEPIRAIMNSWINQPGYPVVELIKDDNNEFKLKQSRFLSSGELLQDKEKKQTWHIAIDYINNEKYREVIKLEKSSGKYSISRNTEWIKINSEQMGFFRVKYPSELLNNLKKAVQKKEISPIDRMGIADDLYALTRAGMIPATELLSFFDAYHNETEYIVWTSIIQSLSELELLFEYDNQLMGFYHIFARGIIQNIAKRLSWDDVTGECEEDKLLRPVVLGAYGHYGHLETIARSREYFKAYCSGSKLINPDLRNMVCRIAAKHGSEEDHDIVLNRYRHETHPEEKLRFLRTLGRFPHDHLAKKSLQFGLSGEVKAQDMTSIIYSTAVNDNREVAKYTWVFIKENWDAIHRRLGQSIVLLEHTVKGSAHSLNSHEEALDFKNFFELNPTPKISKAISQTLEIIHSRANWIARDRESATKWLLDWYKEQEA